MIHADEVKDTTSNNAITKKAFAVIKGIDEDGKTLIPTGKARIDYLKAQNYDPAKVQAKVNELLAYETTANNPSATPTTASTGVQSSAKEWIAQKESGGSYTAENGRYYGRYQLDRSYLNGDLSPENQERVADQYMISRYGSWENAKNFWLTHGWY